ncbi:basic proline-rich protein-like [Nothobranchius furzeri]|uniref:basic proline-rich protein-like n=1 Tax=Nothobranchius furzeri TaxID=105023 RepID=UPI0039048B4C
MPVATDPPRARRCRRPPVLPTQPSSLLRFPTSDAPPRAPVDRGRGGGGRLRRAPHGCGRGCRLLDARRDGPTSGPALPPSSGSPDTAVVPPPFPHLRRSSAGAGGPGARRGRPSPPSPARLRARLPTAGCPSRRTHLGPGAAAVLRFSRHSRRPSSVSPPPTLLRGRRWTGGAEGAAVSAEPRTVAGAAADCWMPVATDPPRARRCRRPPVLPTQPSSLLRFPTSDAPPRAPVDRGRGGGGRLRRAPHGCGRGCRLLDARRDGPTSGPALPPSSGSPDTAVVPPPFPHLRRSSAGAGGPGARRGRPSPPSPARLRARLPTAGCPSRRTHLGPGAAAVLRFSRHSRRPSSVSPPPTLLRGRRWTGGAEGAAVSAEPRTVAGAAAGLLSRGWGCRRPRSTHADQGLRPPKCRLLDARRDGPTSGPALPPSSGSPDTAVVPPPFPHLRRSSAGAGGPGARRGRPSPPSPARLRARLPVRTLSREVSSELPASVPRAQGLTRRRRTPPAGDGGREARPGRRAGVGPELGRPPRRGTRPELSRRASATPPLSSECGGGRGAAPLPSHRPHPDAHHRWEDGGGRWGGQQHPTTTSDQTRQPAEFKHITKRRKRN